LTLAKFTVRDATGNPIAGANVAMTSSAGWCNGNTVDGATDSNGNVQLDNGCWSSSSVTYSVSAVGYQSKTNQTAQLVWPGPTQINVTLNAVQGQGPGGLCLPGYVNQNGQCVQASGTNWLSWLENNWLFVLLIVAVIIFILVTFLNPQVLGIFLGK
jgi:hypothetical protein